MPSRDELDRLAQRVPNQKGSRLDQVDGLATWNVDVTKVAPIRNEPSSSQVADPGLTGSRPAKKGGGSNG